MAAAVAGITLPLDQPALLELVEDMDKLAAVEREEVGQRPLRLAGPLAEGRQHPVLIHAEAGLLELPDHAGFDGNPELGQEEHRAGQQLLGEAGSALLKVRKGRAHGNKGSSPNRCKGSSWN